MRVLVTGVTGFVGRHVLDDLHGAGYEALGFDLEPPPGLAADRFAAGDLRDPASVENAVRRLHPDACIHLGGIAFVPTGWSYPHLVFEVNLVGTIHLLESFRRFAPSARLLVVSSAEVYGQTGGDGAIAEDAPLTPSNLYAVAKAAADASARLHAQRYGMPVMTARPQNHIGPGQSPLFVTSSFAEQIARIAAGTAEPVLRVGNLDSERDFTDVRDVARAYRLLIEKGRAGEAYNIASGRRVRIREVLDQLCAAARVRPAVETDPGLFRPADRPRLLNTEKILLDTGWRAQIPLPRTLSDILADARARLAGSH